MFDYINPAILPLGFFFFICSVVGVIGNAIMVFCTLRTKRFRSPCHILICATCIADLLHVCGQFPFCVHLFGNLTSSQAQCYYILTIPIVGFTTGGPLILSMGIDRLIAVKFPTKYRYYQEEPKMYVIGQLSFPAAYSIAFLIYGFLERDTNVKNQLICSNPLSLNGLSFQMYTYTSGIIYIFVFFVYLAVYVMLKSNKASARFKNVFRSILVTVGFVLLGWVTTTTANTLSYAVTSDLMTIQLIQMYAGITVNFAAASNVFVFYAINSEYRSVIQSMFGCNRKGGTPVFEASSTQTVTKVTPARSSSQPSIAFQQKAMAARRMTIIDKLVSGASIENDLLLQGSENSDGEQGGVFGFWTLDCHPSVGGVLMDTRARNVGKRRRLIRASTSSSASLTMFDYIPKEILPLGFFMFFCALIGVIGNFIMLLCSFRTKRFRSPCHILITATCLADAIHISGQFPFCVHLFANLTSSQAQCYYMLTLPIIGLTSGGPLILAMGIDRLIAVRFPTKYRYFQEEKTMYICGQMLFPVGYAVFFLVYGFLVRDTDIKNQITCANPMSLNGTAFQMFTYSSGIIYIFVFIVYLTVYILLKSNQASARFKSVFRSLAVTVGLVMFGWVSTTTANTLSYSITDSAYTAQLIQMYAGITVNTAAASNVFVFYAINSEYREVIKALFGFNSKANSPLFEASSTMVTVRSDANLQKRRMTIISQTTVA